MGIRMNNQVQPKQGQIYTYDTLCTFDMETLLKIKEEMDLRLHQRGSSRPVITATEYSDNKLNEREYLKIIRRVIKEKKKSENKSENKIFKFNEFSKKK